MTSRTFCYACLLPFFALVALNGQPKQQPAGVEIVAHVLQPERVDATPDRIATLKLPTGFHIQKFAEGLGKPRIIAVADDGSVYVTRREPGDCLLLVDVDGDGRSDQQKVVAKQAGLHGIAIHGDAC